MTRRTFYQRIIYGLTSLITVALALPAVGYLLVPSRNRKDSGWTEAGDVTTLRLGEPKKLVFHKKRVDGWKTSTERATAWVVKTNEEVIAFAPQCTHLGCGYNWVGEKKHFYALATVRSSQSTDKSSAGPPPARWTAMKSEWRANGCGSEP